MIPAWGRLLLAVGVEIVGEQVVLVQRPFRGVLDGEPVAGDVVRIVLLIAGVVPYPPEGNDEVIARQHDVLDAGILTELGLDYLLDRLCHRIGVLVAGVSNPGVIRVVHGALVGQIYHQALNLRVGSQGVVQRVEDVVALRRAIDAL